MKWGIYKDLGKTFKENATNSQRMKYVIILRDREPQRLCWVSLVGWAQFPDPDLPSFLDLALTIPEGYKATQCGGCYSCAKGELNDQPDILQTSEVDA